MKDIYYVNFGTGVGNFYEDSLLKAMARADKEVSYTQNSICIFEDETLIALRPWWGVGYEEPDQKDDIISFGSYGYYGPWEVF